MSEAFLGEIRLFAGNYVPDQWHICDGTIFNVNDNMPLFGLLGAIYGGNGHTTFALPDLRYKLPIQYGKGLGLSLYQIGQTGGGVTKTFDIKHMPAHTHPVVTANVNATALNPDDGQLLAIAYASSGPPAQRRKNMYYQDNSIVGHMYMASDAVQETGGGPQEVENTQPFLTLNYIICVGKPDNQTIFYPQRQ
ncbi:MAG: phage tail protein [Alphaproteobacteria bacterium]|nr:MAG: phage tail protein [Alphaproteobacteria bacterium]